MIVAAIVITGIVIVTAAVIAYSSMLLTAMGFDQWQQQRDEQDAPLCAKEPEYVRTIRDAAPRVSVDAKSNSPAAV